MICLDVLHRQDVKVDLLKGPITMTNDRVRTVVNDLERTLRAFIREHGITHAEYRAATDAIVAGVEAGERTMMFDAFLEADTVDIDNQQRGGTIQGIEGPFYVEEAPWLEGPPYVLPQRPDEGGMPLVFHGRITSPDGEPLVGVTLDMWHADAEGRYSQIHPGVPEWNLRGRFLSDENGSFAVSTITPPPYEIPKNGPGGALLKSVGRPHLFRPAHLHVKLRHPYFGAHITQLYFPNDKYIDNDVANAVREGLILDARVIKDPERIAQQGFEGPFMDAHYDFVFAPASVPRTIDA
jgi:catechol 1,2-dioxygenase